MFAVVEHELIPPLRWRDKLRKQAAWAVEKVDSPRCLKLTVFFPLGAKDAELRRRAKEGFEELARMGVAVVVLPPEFPFRELAAQAGIAVSHPAPLYRRMAGKLCEWAADEMGIAPSGLHVSLVGSRAGSELLACAEHLRDRAGRLSISAGRDTDAVCFGLRKHLGISAGQQFSPDADIIMLFDRQAKPIHISPDSLAIDLTGGVPAVTGGIWANGAHINPPARLGSLNFSAGMPELVAALAASGSVRVSELTPEYLTASGQFVDVRQYRGKCRAASTTNA